MLQQGGQPYPLTEKLSFGHLVFLFYASRIVYTQDLGRTWRKSEVFDFNGKLICGVTLPFKVMSDRVNPNIFYGFGENINGAGFYVSIDQGLTFHQIKAPDGFTEVNLAGIDSEQAYEIRVESCKEGVIWMAMQQHGL